MFISNLHETCSSNEILSASHNFKVVFYVDQIFFVSGEQN